MLSADRLRELLHYDPETGVFTWRTGQRAGCVAGYQHPDGSVTISTGGRGYKAHRLAWLYITGAHPSNQIDHENCVRNDNRFSNLREATSAQNARNRRIHITNSTGLKGVTAKGKKWYAQICADGQYYYLGMHGTPEEAHAAYCAAAAELHGDFARTA